MWNGIGVSISVDSRTKPSDTKNTHEQNSPLELPRTISINTSPQPRQSHLRSMLSLVEVPYKPSRTSPSPPPQKNLGSNSSRTKPPTNQSSKILQQKNPKIIASPNITHPTLDYEPANPTVHSPELSRVG